MKKTLTFPIILLSFTSFSGGFRFPNVNYAYAKLYLMNVNIDGGAFYADYDVFRDGLYANTKVGDGIDLPSEMLDKIHNVMKTGVDELIYGLGKCYIPRHGIIYFDKLGTPVASLSICFECDRISLWSVHEYPEFKDPEKANNWKKAENQMADLKSIMKEYEMPVFNVELEYANYIANDSSLTQIGETFIKDPALDSLYFKKYSIEEIKRWVHRKARRFDLKQTAETKITAGGEEWTYPQLRDERGTRFIFSFDEENPYLVEADINNSAIILPNGVSVGMSLEDVLVTFPVYDGLAWPEKITVSGEKLELEYYFKRRTLVRIKVRVSIV